MRPHVPHNRPNQRAFTLVELLVVIGIIAVLVGILLPSLAAARRQANSTKCLANLRTMQTAQVMYASENRNLLVTAANGATDQGSWINSLDRYAPASLAHRCPSDESPYFDQPVSPGPPPKFRVSSYGINNYLSPTHAPPGITPVRKITQVRNSSQIVQFAELAEAGAYAAADHLHVQSFSLGMPELTVGLVAKQMPLGRHDGKAMGMHSVLNYSFLDGHAETLPLADVYTDPIQNKIRPECCQVSNFPCTSRKMKFNTFKNSINRVGKEQMRSKSRQLAGLAAGIVTLMSAPVVLAHGPQIQISRDPGTGQIITRNILDTHSPQTSLTPVTRVYVVPLLSGTGGAIFTRPLTQELSPGVPEFNSGPGIVYNYDSQFAGNGWEHALSGTVPNLQGSNFIWSASGALLQWNGGGSFVASGAEQLQTYRGAVVDSAITGGPDSIVDFTAVGAIAANPHSSLSHRLFADGVNPGGTGDGNIYLAQYTIDNSLATVNASAPFYFVMYQGTSEAAALAVANSFATAQSIPLGQVQAIPEPASLGLLGGVGMMLLGRRRRLA